MGANLAGHPARLIKLIGYSALNTETDEARRYDRSKEPPKGAPWVYLSEKEATRWEAQGGHVGVVIPEGLIVVDIDDEPTFKALLTGMKHPCTAIKTPKGGQFVFTDPGRVKKQACGMLTLGGVVVDYRLGGKGYIVAPRSSTPERKFVRSDAPAKMPLFFLPVRRSKKDDGARILDVLSYGRGQMLFEHACRLRAYDREHRLKLSPEERLRVLYDVNDVFCSPPKSARDVEHQFNGAEKFKEAPAGSEEAPKARVQVMSKFYPRPFSDALLRDHAFIGEGRRGLLWRCRRSDNLWLPDGEEFIERFYRDSLSDLDDTLKQRAMLGEIVADVKGISYREGGLPEPPVHLVPCRNGVFDLSDHTFRPRVPEDHFSWQLPWNYRPEAECPYLRGLLDVVLDEDDTTLYELLAYCLWRQYPYQKFWLLIGPGRNGKGVFLTILARLLGHGNISGVSLKEIQHSNFAAAQLHRRLANVSGELAYADLRNTSLLKQLCGGDYVMADRKYLDPVRFVNHAKLIFAGNAVPVSHDTTDAFFRRAFLVEFKRMFRDDPRIQVKLQSDLTAEFEGLLALTLRHLAELMDRDFIFTRNTTTEETRELYESLSSPLRRFLQEYCVVTHNREDYITKGELLKEFNEWLKEIKLNAYSEKRLNREMRAMGHEEARRADNGKERPRVWIGIQWVAGLSGRDDGAKNTEESSASKESDQEDQENHTSTTDFHTHKERFEKCGFPGLSGHPPCTEDAKTCSWANPQGGNGVTWYQCRRSGASAEVCRYVGLPRFKCKDKVDIE